MPDWLSDVGNLGLSLVNNIANRQFAREQATTAFNRQVSLMNMQNEYNSPKNQMSRFIAAGLNPNLIYGQLGNGLGAPSVAMGSAQNQSDPQLMLQNYAALQQLKINQQQITNDTQRTQQDIQESLTRMGVNDANAQYLAGLSTTIPFSIAQMEQSIATMSTQQRLTQWDIALKSATFTDSVKQIAKSADLMEKQAYYYGSYLAASILGLKAQATAAFAKARLDTKNATVAEALANLYGAQKSAVDISNSREQVINRDLYGIGFNGSSGGSIVGRDGKSRSYFQNDLFNSAFSQDIQNQYLQKTCDILKKYGDTKEVMGLIESGSSIFKNIADPTVRMMKYFK